MFAQSVFSCRLKQLRIARKLTQEQLAHQLGVSKQAASRWETGERLPTIPLFCDLADFFDVTTDYLLGRD